MIVIGELINGMYKDVSRAVANKEADIIQHLALEQVKDGATMLDVNIGPYSKDPIQEMRWLVETIQAVVDVPLSLDSTKADVIEEGLKTVKKRAVINSTSADPDKMDVIFGLAKKYNAQVIGLTMDKSGVPNNKEKRLELAAIIVAKAIECGINTEDLYLDPVLLPINVAQTQSAEVLESIREFRLLCNPAPQTVFGLSNLSQGTKMRSLINRTFLSMAVANGLT
ncbi:MAG: dihydropteroate synthase, partial [Candidatus Omnitrophota bacterium]